MLGVAACLGQWPGVHPASAEAAARLGPTGPRGPAPMHSGGVAACTWLPRQHCGRPQLPAVPQCMRPPRSRGGRSRPHSNVPGHAFASGAHAGSVRPPPTPYQGGRPHGHRHQGHVHKGGAMGHVLSPPLSPTRSTHNLHKLLRRKMGSPILNQKLNMRIA